MAQAFVTIYNAEGKAETHLRANATDFVRNCDYTWRPGLKLKPHNPANEFIPREADDAPDLSAQNDGPPVRKNSKLGKLKTLAASLGVVFEDNITEKELQPLVDAAKKAGKKAPASAADEPDEE